MWCKCTVFLLIIAITSRLVCGQFIRKFFRKNYIYIDDMNSFYKINTMSKSWGEAKIYCLYEGATLFYPDDEDEAITVVGLWNDRFAHIQEIWIGVAARNAKDVYETIDGRGISDVYEKWAFSEPNNDNGDKDCVVMQKDGNLRVESCNKRYNFFCKKTLATLTWNGECGLPDTEYKYNETLKSCYKFHLTPMNWTDAFVICRAEESHLAIIESQSEDEHLINIIAGMPKESVGGNYLRGAVHLGFHSMNGIWETIKGVPIYKSGFGEGWAYLQPDGGGREKCGSMFYTGQLNDIGCFQQMFFICERETDVPSTVVKNKTRYISSNGAVRQYSLNGVPLFYFLADMMMLVVLNFFLTKAL